MTRISRAGALLAGLLGAVALLLTACASHPGAGALQPALQLSAQDRSATPATTAYVFRPFTSHGKARVAVARTASGYCWNSSLADTSPHAYRCFTGSTILDPCFVPASAQPSTALCVASPWAKAVRLHLTKRLPAASRSDSSRPWAYRLADGTRCVAATGTVPEVAGVNLDFSCTNGRSAALVDPSASRLTAVVAAASSTTVRHESVTAVWRR